jgi:predicted transport protein
MTGLSYIKTEKIILKNHPDYSEKWVQDKIAEDPTILGLGEIILKDKERIQPGFGRLDLLFQDFEENTRYEVELQLGKTDESHIIRTLEYWDNEKKHNPTFDHIAVIIAEDITNRFLNVIHLFNGVIPLIAIQMEAIKFEDKISLLFTKVLDQKGLSIFEEDEPVEPTNRTYWEKRGTKKTVELADELLKIAKTIDTQFELKYNKFYIGFARDGQPFNFVTLKPQKTGLRMELKLTKSDEIKIKLEAANLEIIGYSIRYGMYIIRLSKDDITQNNQLLSDLCKQSYIEFGGDYNE